jgi:2-haloacid dehalogenase
MDKLTDIKALTFDLFGTILDLGSSLEPAIAQFLQDRGSDVSPQRFWADWRSRQRIEQYQDSLLMLGHSGYLETVRRALVYTLALHRVEAEPTEVRHFMQAWQQLSPFSDVVPALARLQSRYRLIVLSNGDPHYLDHLVQNQVGWEFDRVISVAEVGVFKPHPGVYRRAAGVLNLEMAECLMVSANSFDVLGARTCGYRAAFVNRYGLPYEDAPYRPDMTVQDFSELADILLDLEKGGGGEKKR